MELLEIIKKLNEKDRLELIESLKPILDKNTYTKSQYDSLKCELSDSEDEVRDLTDDNKELENDISELEDKIDDLQSIFSVNTLMDEFKMKLLQEVWKMYSFDELEQIFNIIPGKEMENVLIRKN